MRMVSRGFLAGTCSTGVAIILATVAGAMAFVLLYMGAFALADWD